MDFVIKLIVEFLESIEVEHVLGSPYNSQSQDAVEALNKNAQRKILRALDNSQKSNEKYNLEFNLNNFIHY